MIRSFAAGVAALAVLLVVGVLLLAAGPVLPLFGMAFLALGGCAGAALVLCGIRHLWRMSDVARERGLAEAAQGWAEAEAIRAQARLVPVAAGGAFGYVDAQAGIVLSPQINANVPYSYSPHVSVAPQKPLPQEGSIGAGMPLPQENLPLDLPGVTELAACMGRWQPHREAILLALGAGGQPITVSWTHLCHVALAGATRGGKSSIMRLLLVQLVAAGALVYLADPHFTPFDAETGEDWRPIARRLAAPPAFQDADIARLLRWLALDELARRLDRRRAGLKVGPPLFLALDELPRIVKGVPDAPDHIGRLLREGGKVGLLVIGAAQDFLVKTIGSDGAVRDCYRTSYYVGGDDTTARVLLDMRGRVDDGTLGKGVVMLRSSATSPAERVRVPLVSNATLYAMLAEKDSEEGIAGYAPTREGAREYVEEPNRVGVREAHIYEEGVDTVAKTARVDTPIYEEGLQGVAENQPDLRPIYRLPAPMGSTARPRPTPDAAVVDAELRRAQAAYKSGHNTSRKLAVALGCGKDKANNLINTLRAEGLV